MQDYRKLKVWEKAHAFGLEAHRLCDAYPRRSGTALAPQLRRAALSIASNIVEGTSKTSQPEVRRFLVIALASAGEADYQLLVARDTGLMDPAVYANTGGTGGGSPPHALRSDQARFTEHRRDVMKPGLTLSCSERARRKDNYSRTKLRHGFNC